MPTPINSKPIQSTYSISLGLFVCLLLQLHIEDGSVSLPDLHDNFLPHSFKNKMSHDKISNLKHTICSLYSTEFICLKLFYQIKKESWLTLIHPFHLISLFPSPVLCRSASSLKTVRGEGTVSMTL